MGADRDAILVALLEAVGELPPHFDLERFGREVERWERQGKSTKEIAALVLAQCEAKPKQPRRPTDGFFTVQAHYHGGGLFRAVEHVLGAEIDKLKRRLERESSGRLVFTLLSEGTKPRSVQGSFDFKPATTPAKPTDPEEPDSPWGWPTHRQPQQMGFWGSNSKK